MRYENIPSVKTLQEYVSIHPTRDFAECIDPVTGTVTSLAILGEHNETHDLVIVPLKINMFGTIDAMLPKGNYSLHFFVDRKYKVPYTRMLKQKIHRLDEIYSIKIGQQDETYHEYGAIGNSSMVDAHIEKLLTYLMMSRQNTTELSGILNSQEIHAPVDITILQSYTDFDGEHEYIIPEAFFSLNFRTIS